MPDAVPSPAPTAPPPPDYQPSQQELATSVDAPSAPPPVTAPPADYQPSAQELSTSVDAPASPQGQTVSPLHDFTVDQLVNAAKDDPQGMDPVSLYMQSPEDVQHDPVVRQKAADAYHQLRVYGEQHPFAGFSVTGALKAGAKGIGDLAKTYGKELGIITAPLTDLGDESALKQSTDEAARSSIEFLGGQKVMAMGLGQMIGKGMSWVGRHIPGAAKPLAQYSPDDTLKSFEDELATRQIMADEVKNAGGFFPDVQKTLASEGKPIRPEAVATSASGSPFAWWTAGKIFNGISSTVSSAVAPGIAAALASGSGEPVTQAMVDAVQSSLDQIPVRAGNLVAAGTGNLISAVGKAGAAIAEKVEPLLEPVGKAVGAAAGAVTGHHVVGLPGVAVGIAEGFKRGGELGEQVAGWTGKAALKFDGLADMGHAIATGEGVKNTFSGSVGQFIRDTAQQAPGAILHAGVGAGMDAGLMATTTDTPEERQNFTPFGTLFGTLSGAKGIAKWGLSGNIVAPRDWGVAGRPIRPDSFAAAFPALDAVHEAGYGDATEGVQQRYNAVQKFVDGAAPGTQVIYAPRPKEGQADPLPDALEQSGIPASWADQDGFTTKVNGQRVVVVRNIDAAPHEARHAMDDVVGAQGTQALNQTAQQEFSGDWNSFKQQYANRLAGSQVDNPDQTILDLSGHGDAQAREKIIAQVKDNLVQEGQDPTDTQVKDAAANLILQRRGEAQQAGQSLWEHTLTPEEQRQVSDDYVASEIRAENHDAWFKAGQPGALRGKMGMAAANTLAALGINPLEGRATTYGTPVTQQLINQAGQTAPGAPSAPTPAAPGSPQAQQQDVLDAQKAAQTASGLPVPGANKSQKEVLGTLAEAIARKQPVKITGLFAPDEPAASLTSDRPTRRAMIEAFRSMPDAAKKMWGKLFNPHRVLPTGRGALQVFGWSPEVFAANAHKAANAANALADKGVSVVPSAFELDPVTRSFTDAGWQNLFDKVNIFNRNQANGFTGSGLPLNVPASVVKAGGHAPAVRGEPIPLPQDEADFINYLYNSRLPNSGIARQGEINLPLNIAGQEISEATLPGRVEAPVTDRGAYRGAVAARQGVTGRRILEVNPFRNKFESALQQYGVEAPSLIEANQRLNIKNIKDIELAPEQGPFGANTLTLQAGFQPPKNTKDFIDFLDNSTPEDYHSTVSGYQGRLGGGQTGLSFDVGSTVRNADEVAALRSASNRYGELVSGALKNKDFNSAAGFASRAQAAREAYEAATDTGGAGDFIRAHRDPNYRGPLSETPTASFQTRIANPDLRKVEDQFLKGREGFRGYEPVNTDYAKQIAEEYQSAVHAPENPEVAASYSALKRDTLAQWNALQNAGYKMEPWTGPGQPYFTSAQMAADVRDNQHLWYFPTESGFGETAENVGHPLLEDTGERVNGTSVLYNDAFRAVHAAFGHAKEGYEFGPRGEYNAFLSHSRMFSPEALPAMAAETLGKNSWVNFGPHLRDANGNIPGRGESGYVAPKDRPFAEQKATTISPTARFMHSLEGIRRMNDEEVARQQRSAETETSRNSSYAGDAVNGIVLHSAKQRSTAFLKGGPESEEFENAWKSAPNQSERNNLVEGYFMPRKSNEWELRPGSSRFLKAWILPTGELAQFGGQWHDDWLNSQPDIRKKYKLPISKNNQDENRIPAIKQGFGRVNYDKSSGRLTIEAREKNWPDMLPSVQELVKNNLDKFDKIAVHLLDNSGKKLSSSAEREFFSIPAENRVSHIPFSGGEGELPQSGMAGEEGSQQVFNRAAREAFGAEQTAKTVEANLRAMGWPESKIKSAVQDFLTAKKVNFQPGGSPRAIRAAAVQDADTGEIFEGPLHFYAHSQMLAAGYPASDLFRHPQGFITNEGEFLTRDQARERAQEMNQLRPVSAARDLVSLARTGSQVRPIVSEDLVLPSGSPEVMRQGTQVANQIFPETTTPQTFALDAMEERENTAMNAQPKTFLVRHGSTEMNNPDPEKDLIRGHINVQLDKKGRQEAQDVADQIKNAGGITHIVASDLDRTMDTARAISKETGATIEPEPGFRPWKLGPTIEGKPTADMLPVIQEYADTPDQRPPGGESFNEFKDRFLNAFHRVQDEHPDENTAIVTHYRGAKLMDAWRATGTDNDTIDKTLFETYDKNRKPGSAEVLDKAGAKLGDVAAFQAPKPEEFEKENTLPGALTKSNWAILTATQEARGPATAEVNKIANENLEKALISDGFNPVPVSGSYKGVDQGKSFLVTGMTPKQAQEWGNKYSQESVITPHGLLYGDGSMNPIDPSKNLIGGAAKKQDGWSQVKEGPPFSLGVDFDKKVPAQFQPRPEEGLLEGLGTPRALSSKEVGDMTKAELAAHYPESVIPQKRDEEIPSEITSSPLYKQAGSREAAVKAFADKLVNFVRQSEKNPGYRAGTKWYSDFTPKLKKVFKKSSQMMAELLAATSPNNNPTNNFAFAYDALHGYESGRFTNQLAKFHEGLQKIEDGSWKKWAEKNMEGGATEAGFLAHWIDKFDLYPRQSNGQLYSMYSVPVLKVFARKWLGQTTGPKTQNFVKNLLGSGHEATIDVWADRTMRRLGYADSMDRWRILPKNVKGVSDEDFAFSQDAFREAAKQLGMKPDALQGGLWFAEKQLWADKGWGRLDLGDYRNEIEKVPMLKKGIEERLARLAARQNAPQEEQSELLVTPRENKL